MNHVRACQYESHRSADRNVDLIRGRDVLSRLRMDIFNTPPPLVTRDVEINPFRASRSDVAFPTATLAIRRPKKITVEATTLATTYFSSFASVIVVGPWLSAGATPCERTSKTTT